MIPHRCPGCRQCLRDAALPWICNGDGIKVVDRWYLRGWLLAAIRFRLPDDDQYSVANALEIMAIESILEAAA